MAELPEWSAQALRCQGSDGPVKVIYFRSRGEVGGNDSFAQYYASRKERPELDQSISFKPKALGELDSRAVFSGRLFDQGEVSDSRSDSRNFKKRVTEYFEDWKSAFEDLKSRFNNTPKVVPLDLESSYGPKYYVPSEEDDLLWYYFLDCARQDGGQKEANKQKEDEEEKKKEKRKREEKKEEKEEEKEASALEKKVDEDKAKTKKVDKDEDEKRALNKKIKWIKELDGITPPDVRLGYLCALIFGITTEFNPSGTWIVEDFFYDEEVE